MDATEAKVARLQKLLPKMSPEVRAKAQGFLASHGVEQRTGFIGSGRGDQTEGLPPAGPEKPAFEDMVPSNAKIPEHPSALSTLGGDAASRLGALALGRFGGMTAGIGPAALRSGGTVERKAAEWAGQPPRDEAEVATLMSQGMPKEGGTDPVGELVRSTEEEHPGLEFAGTFLGRGGLPAYFEKKASEVLGAIARRSAEKAAANAPALSREAQQAAEMLEMAKPPAATSMLKQGAEGLKRGMITGALTSATNSAAEVADSELRTGTAGTDLASEIEKGIMSMLITGGTSSILSALGAIPKAIRDNRTNAGSGGLAEKVTRLERMKGGKIGPGGVTPPEGLSPLYAEAMVGGQPVAPGLRTGTVAEGPQQEGPVGELFRNKEPPALTRPGMRVQDLAAEKALVPVQQGIAETQTSEYRKIAQAQQQFLGSSAQHQQVEPKPIMKVLQKYITARTFKDGAPVPYADSGEPIQELNKLVITGDPVSSVESANALRRNPGFVRMKMSDALAMGLNVKGGAEAPIDSWVVVQPRMVNPVQLESAMQGINKTVANSKYTDAMHTDLQHAGFETRQLFEWPADAGPKPPSYHMVFPENRGAYAGSQYTGLPELDHTKGHTTLNGWAALQARASDLLKDTEKNLYRIGTNPAEATNETRGAEAILNSLRSMGEPGRNRADDALWNLGKDQRGGRKALGDMEAVNMIEGPGGLRKATELSNPLWPFREHDRRALTLRADPALQAAGRAGTVAGTAVPAAEALQPYLHQLLQGISARMGR